MIQQPSNKKLKRKLTIKSSLKTAPQKETVLLSDSVIDIHKTD